MKLLNGFAALLFLFVMIGCGPTLQQRKAMINNRQMVITRCAGPEIDSRCIQEATKFSCGGRPVIVSMDPDLQEQAARAFGESGNHYYIIGECL